jgi:hypothetical protein
MRTLAPSWHEPQVGPAGRYKIRGLSGLEFLEMQDLVGADAGEDWKVLAKSGRGDLSPKVVRFVLEAGVIEWADLGADAITGDRAERFRRERVNEICFDHVMNLVVEIIARSLPGEDLEKNSLSQSRSQATGGPSTAQAANGGNIARP